MSTINLTVETFEETVMADGITLVDFWAEWCGPCKMFGPIFEKAAEAKRIGTLNIRDLLATAPTDPLFADPFHLKETQDAMRALNKDRDYGWGVRVRRHFGARGRSSVRYGTRLAR